MLTLLLLNSSSPKFLLKLFSCSTKKSNTLFVSSKSIERSLRVRREDCGLREPSSAAGSIGSGRSCGRSVATAGAEEVGDGLGGCDTGPLIVEDLMIG